MNAWEGAHLASYDYYAQAVEPWPLRIVNGAGVQQFGASAFEEGVPSPTTFAPQACCARDPVTDGDPRASPSLVMRDRRWRDEHD